MIAIPAAVALFFAGATTASASPGIASAASGGTMTVDVPAGTWPTLDPALPTAETSEAQYFAQIYGVLFTVSASGKYTPDLATGYKITDGGKTVTIDLRKGVTFSDGTPFNAAAVKFNIARDANPKTNCLCQTLLNPSNLIKSIGTPNAQTVVLNLARPYSPIMSVLTTSTAAFMVSPTALSKEGATQFQTHPVGAGPFLVQSDEPSATLSLVKNPHYWQKGQPLLDSLHFVSVGSTASAISSVASGTAQVATTLGPADLTTAKSLHVKTEEQPVLNYYFVQMNQYKAPFNNAAARLALFEATNPQAIVESVDQGARPVEELEAPAQSPFYGYTVPGFPKYNLQKAKAAVKKLGGLSFDMITIANDSRTVATADALQKEWTAAGIKANVTVLSHAQAVTDNTTGNLQAELDLYGIYQNPLLGEYTMVECGNATNHVYCDKSADDILDQIGATNSTSAQLKLYGKLWNIVMDKDHGLLPLATEPLYDAVSPKVQGSPIAGILPYYQDIGLSKS